MQKGKGEMGSMTLKAMFAGVLLALPLCVLAQGNTMVDAKAGSFTEQRAKVEADLADGETYAEISAADRAAVIEALDTIEDTLRGRPASELNGSPLTEVMNAQALINNKLTQAGEDSRVVCKREASVGTRLARSQCLTVAQRRRGREESQDYLRQNRNQLEDFRGM